MSVIPGTDLSDSIATVLTAAFAAASPPLVIPRFSAYVLQGSAIPAPGYCVYMRKSQAVMRDAYSRRNDPSTPNIYRVALLSALYSPKGYVVETVEAFSKRASFVLRTAFNNRPHSTLNGNAVAVDAVGWDNQDDGPLIEFRGQTYFGGYLTLRVLEAVQR